ncbi:MAG: ADP-ribosylglycohydrolase family protein [Bacteroidaceae bacterium]|nr:ADP-ribosylglycohydrolase family protein [Bacteroidaceae bacterium]
MKPNLFLGILLATLTFTTSSCQKQEMTETTREQLLDKIRGGWAGQLIGCTYGGPTEFRYRGEVIPDETPIQWNPGCVAWYYDNQPGLYDDLYMDLTFVDVLHRLGLDAPTDSLAMAFAHAPYPLWHANQAARNNLLNGILPPLSGHWTNNPHADDIDYQIEADFAGLVSPGMPNAASALSDRVGHIMNYGDGWYGGVFVGAMYSLAFVRNDVRSIVCDALQTIPAGSRFRQCMEDIIAWHSQNPDDWKATWQLCQDRYADEVGCPEGVNAPLDIDALINSAYIVIGLLYGDGDFARTLEISTRCGQDSDCNPASAGGILGCMLGYSNIPEEWMNNLREVEDRDFAYTHISMNRAYQMTLDLALRQIEAQGGRVGEDIIAIPLQQPQPVQMEQSFPGLRVAQILDGRQIQDLDSLSFEGTGIVVRSYVNSPDPAYIAEVDVTIDGQHTQTVQAPVAFHNRRQELCWDYGLQNGPHTLSLRWLNPIEGAEINCYRIIIYGTTE